MSSVAEVSVNLIAHHDREFPSGIRVFPHVGGVVSITASLKQRRLDPYPRREVAEAFTVVAVKLRKYD
jgi:hypothetical protein